MYDFNQGVFIINYLYFTQWHVVNFVIYLFVIESHGRNQTKRIFVKDVSLTSMCVYTHTKSYKFKHITYTWTIPASHKFFNAIRYLVSPKRSRYRLQNANVEKFLLIVASNCFALANLRGMWPTSKFFM